MRRRCCCVSNKCSAKFSYEHSSDDCETCFTDLSTASTGCTITGWSWLFSDGATSTAQNPCHTFDLQNTPFPPWAKLTITTSCGNECTIQNNLNIPCQNSPPICYPSLQESLPTHFLATFNGMAPKSIVRRQFVFKPRANILDPDSRILCNYSFGPQSLFSERDFSSLNSSFEIPYLTGPDISGFTTYYSGSFSAEALRWYQEFGLHFPNVAILPENTVPCYLFIQTSFDCDSIGSEGSISALWSTSPTSTFDSDYRIGFWQKTFTLPPGVKLKDAGPIALDAFNVPYREISTAGVPQGWTYPYSDPCGETPNGTLASLPLPTCIITPNG